jgi:hypothetical protein
MILFILSCKSILFTPALCDATHESTLTTSCSCCCSAAAARCCGSVRANDTNLTSSHVARIAAAVRRGSVHSSRRAHRIAFDHAAMLGRADVVRTRVRERFQRSAIVFGRRRPRASKASHQQSESRRVRRQRMTIVCAWRAFTGIAIATTASARRTNGVRIIAQGTGRMLHMSVRDATTKCDARRTASGLCVHDECICVKPSTGRCV